jgi:acetyl esterase/lipase
MLVSLRDRGIPLPACTWCSSPWVDLEAIGGSMTAKASVDPLIQKAYLMELAAAYLKGADPRTPLASPLYADLRGLPPMLIQVGSAETLLDDPGLSQRSHPPCWPRSVPPPRARERYVGPRMADPLLNIVARGLAPTAAAVRRYGAEIRNTPRL